MVSSLNPTRLSNARVLRITALRAFSLRGRPGLREALATVATLGMHTYLIKNKSDTHRLASICFYTSFCWCGYPTRGLEWQSLLRMSLPRTTEGIVDVDCRFSAAQAIHVRRDRPAGSEPHSSRRPAHPDRYFPGH